MKKKYPIQEKVYIEVGHWGFNIMPHSEVCMHLKIAGKLKAFELLSPTAVQLYEEGRQPMHTPIKHSAPITPGEAGIYTEKIKGKTQHYYYITVLADDEALHLDAYVDQKTLTTLKAEYRWGYCRCCGQFAHRYVSPHGRNKECPMCDNKEVHGISRCLKLGYLKLTEDSSLTQTCMTCGNNERNEFPEVICADCREQRYWVRDLNSKNCKRCPDCNRWMVRDDKGEYCDSCGHEEKE
jgi:hypothetical protein